MKLKRVDKQLSRFATLILGMMLLMQFANPVQAQVGISIDSDLTTPNFPDGISFALKVRSTAAIDQVVLIYRTNDRSCLSSSALQDVEIQPDTALTARWDWKYAGLPPGAEVSWKWQIHDAAGHTFTTPERHLAVDDYRYTWRKLQAGGVSVEWTAGDYTFGQLLLTTATTSLARLAKEASVPQPKQARLIIYPSSTELRAAAPGLSDWAGGVAFPAYGTIMIGIAPGETQWLAKVIPHELAHLVVDQRIDNCAGNRLPTWFNEGLARFAEGPTSAEDRKLVLDALRSGEIQPFLGLTAEFPVSTARANLAYAQSGMAVSFLVEQYGGETIDRLLAQVQQGTAIDTALRDVYGMDTAGIDQAWRAFIGYTSPSSAGTPTSTPAAKRTTVPTFALYATALPSATPTITPSDTVPPTVTSIPPTSLPSATAPAVPVSTAAPSSPAETGGFSGWLWVLAGAVVMAAAAGIFWWIRKHA